jgi:hypothetical protein
MDTISMFADEVEVVEYGRIQKVLDGWLATPLTDLYVPVTFGTREKAELYLELCNKFATVANKKRQ